MQSPVIELAGSQIKISFEYYLPYIQKVKSIPHARWVPGERVWTVPYNKTSLDLVRAAFEHVKLSDLSAKKIQEEEKTDIELAELKYLPKVKDLPITDFEFATKPYWHQKVTFGFCRALDCSAIFLEQGLGKAKVCIDLATWRFRRGQIKRCLIVCPVYVLTQWAVEIEKHGHADFKNYLVLEDGMPSVQRKQLLAALPADWCGFIIINFDGLRPLYDFLLQKQAGQDTQTKLFQMLVLDESSKIKHATSQRSKIAWRLGRTVRYRNIMTGTMITQSIEDIFSQYRYLDERIFGPYATAFRSQFLIMGGFENRVIKGYKNVDALMRRIYSVAIRFTKDKCLDLPPKVFERREIRLDPATSAKYMEFEKKCVAEFAGKVVTAAMVMTKSMKLSQVTGGFIYEQGPDGKKIGTIRLATNPKLAALEDMLEEILPKKVIIWYRFTAEQEMIVELLNKLKIKFVALGKGVSKEDRKKAVEVFQTDKTYPVFMANVTSGIGITLTAAQVVIYYSNSYSYEDRIQSEDRCHRIGLDHKVTYIDLVAVLSDGNKIIDDDVLGIKDSKARLANEVSVALMQRMAVRQNVKLNFSISGSATSNTFTEEEF